MITAKDKRLGHAYAVQQLRKLGRELVAGSWSRAARPMTVPQAAVAMSRALVYVFDSGFAAVVDSIDDKLTELLADVMHPAD